MTIEYLYHADDIRTKIRTMFSKQNAHRRRVIIAAYIGKDAVTFLEEAKGIEVYCWPLAGATNPTGIAQLKSRVAIIHFAQGLHSKVYWVSGIGGLVTSANLSASALEDRMVRHEAGVFIDTMTEHVIEKLIRESNAKQMTNAEFAKLQAEHEAFWLRGRGRSPNKGKKSATPALSYAEWYRGRIPVWKINYPTARGVNLEDVARQEAARRTRKADIEPHDYISGFKGDYKIDDWVLYVEPGLGAGLRDFTWIRLDYYIPVGSPKRSRCLYQGVQIFPLPSEVPTPFRLDAAFKKAFAAAFSPEFHDELHPSTLLLKRISENISQ